MMSSYEGHINVVRILVQHGALLNIQCKVRTTHFLLYFLCLTEMLGGQIVKKYEVLQCYTRASLQISI